MAPIMKKPSAGSSAKSGTGILGKASSSVGKSSGINSTGKSTNIMGSSGKSSKFTVSCSSSGYSSKSSSFLGSSPKNDALLGSSGKSKTSPISSKPFSMESSGKASGTSGKTASIFGYSGKSEPMSSSSGKAKISSSTEKSSFLMPTGKSSNILGSPEKSNKSSLFSGKSASDGSKDYPSFINPQNNKSQTRIGIIWIPTRKRNKKKDVVYNSHNYERNHEKSPSMYSYMSGDSSSFQQPHKNKEEETNLLVPDRPKVATVAVNTGITAASIDVPSENVDSTNAEEKQEFIKHDSEDRKEASGDTSDTSNKNDSDYLENNDNIAKSQENKWDNEKHGDKVDSVYLRARPPHKTRSAPSTNEEEDCGIKCLYYTLQCCDCVLM